MLVIERIFIELNLTQNFIVLRKYCPSYMASQVNSANAADHSASSMGFLARKLIPNVPKFAALDD
jgi:hypothetical protein